MLALWSAPRCRSTAFARMMTERDDRVVVHEPFSRVVDFGEVEVGDRVAHTEQDVLAALRAIAAEKPVFFKDTTDFHYPALLADESFLSAATHTFIIRDPAEAIASHHVLNPDLGRDEIGFARLHEIFAAVQDAAGTTPVVIDSDDLLDRPAETVRAYCSAVGIPFLPGRAELGAGHAVGMADDQQVAPVDQRDLRLHARHGRRRRGGRGRPGAAGLPRLPPAVLREAARRQAPAVRPRGHDRSAGTVASVKCRKAFQ